MGDDGMNRCTCQMGMLPGPHHATFCPMNIPLGPPKPPPFAEPDFSRSPEGMFEGMSRAGLSQLADSPVGTQRRINGHEVWRWEESSPVTRIFADGHPEGEVTLTAAWMMGQPDLGGPDSPLRAAMARWGGLRTWWQDQDLTAWRTRIRWEPRVEPEHAPGAILTYAGLDL